MTVDIETTEETLRVEDIKIDPAYQRCRSKAVEKRIANAFSDLLCDRIVVGRRTDDSLHAVDGQTRLNASKLCGRETIKARVFRSRGRQHEAEMFVALNANRRSVKAADHFRAAVEMGEPNAVELKSALDRYGLKVEYGKTWPCVTGIAKLRDAQKDGHLFQILDVVTKCWHGRKESVQELLLGSLRELFFKFPDIHLDRCIDRWKRHDPTYFLRGKDMAIAAGGNKYKAVAQALLSSYNSGLRSNRLEW